MEARIGDVPEGAGPAAGDTQPRRMFVYWAPKIRRVIEVTIR